MPVATLVMAGSEPNIRDRCARTDPKFVKAAVDRRLRVLLPAPGRQSNELAAALSYSLLAPGKRIRPILTVLAAWEMGEQNLTALDAGCALEMVHAASLILDDLPAMDDADTRRGQPATHVRFGEDVAMLAAITLLSMAYGTIGGMAHVPGDIRCDLIGILARAIGPDGLAGGQYADLRPRMIDGVHAAAEANKRKTGALFVAAAEIATTLQGVSRDEARGLHRSVGELGQAYQLFDDLIDSADVGRNGRPQDADKATIPSLVGLEASRTRLRRHVDVALDGLRPASPLAGYIRALFEPAWLETVPA